MAQVDRRHTFNLSTLHKLGKELTEEPDNGPSNLMCFEANRISTYQGWPLEYFSKEELARKGFYYTKKDDIVKCAFCSIELGHWNVGDDVAEDHRKWRPNCPYLKGGPGCGNVPMSKSEGQDACALFTIFGIQLSPNSFPENEEPSLATLGIQGISPTHKEYAQLDTRIKSFQEWPISKIQKAEELAEAGLFYTGNGDKTICFFCGGGLKNWEEEDVAWEQHARWFSKCGFLRQQKSVEYINEACKKYEAVLSSEQVEDLVPNVPSTSDEKILVSKVATKENSDITKAFMCKICYVEEVGVVFLPCGHMVACISCAEVLTKCSVCQRELEEIVRSFFS